MILRSTTPILNTILVFNREKQRTIRFQKLCCVNYKVPKRFYSVRKNCRIFQNTDKYYIVVFSLIWQFLNVIC